MAVWYISCVDQSLFLKVNYINSGNKWFISLKDIVKYLDVYFMYLQCVLQPTFLS